jgi:hypothetical protein
MSAPLEILEERTERSPTVEQSEYYPKPDELEQALDEAQAPAEAHPSTARSETPPVEGSPDFDGPMVGPNELEQDINNASLTVDDKPQFFFDLKGDTSIGQSQDRIVHVPERPDPQDSDSSGEVILFRGRDAMQPADTTTITMSQIRNEIQVVEEEIQNGSSIDPFGPNSTKSAPNCTRKGRRQSRPRHRDNVDDELVADYIENMRQSGEMDDMLTSVHWHRRDLGGSLSDDSSSDHEEHAHPNVGDTGDVDASGDAYPSETEIDDATLARLIAGQDDVAIAESGAYDANSGSNSESSYDDIITNQAMATMDAFDVMDWSRPSLRPRKKGKGAKAQVNFGISDSELEEKLQAAFRNDRLKKANRKKQREELRALGQLGKNAKDPEDMTVKYPGGMTVEQVGEEIRTFLLNTRETISFPPMDPHARKIIHEIASKFNIKSKSAGKGDQRRPALYRTGRTLPYVESTFDHTVRRIHRRYLPRTDQKGKRREKAKPVRPGGTSGAAASYRNGEVVGGAAPELGTENRGRAMLEKMGWSSGTALGASNNKGILEPVSQTMKTNKAGLG